MNKMIGGLPSSTDSFIEWAYLSKAIEEGTRSSIQK